MHSGERRLVVSFRFIRKGGDGGEEGVDHERGFAICHVESTEDGFKGDALFLSDDVVGRVVGRRKGPCEFWDDSA